MNLHSFRFLLVQVLLCDGLSLQTFLKYFLGYGNMH